MPDPFLIGGPAIISNSGGRTSGKMTRETPEELAKVRDLILAERDKGNIVVSTIEGLMTMPLDEFVKQPADGMLYDLNRGEEVSLTFLSDRKWVNDFAVALVIRRLAAELAAAEQRAEQARILADALMGKMLDADKLADFRNNTLNQLDAIHNALDAALGDTDITHIEDDEELREQYPVQWAATQLAMLLRAMEAEQEQAAAQGNRADTAPGNTDAGHAAPSSGSLPNTSGTVTPATPPAPGTDDARTLERRCATLSTELAAYKQTAPLCDEHRPQGGVRANCLVCGLIEISHALSEIDYLCDEPNDMHVSSYDVHCDPNVVIAHVQKLKDDLAEARQELMAMFDAAGERNISND